MTLAAVLFTFVLGVLVGYLCGAVSANEWQAGERGQLVREQARLRKQLVHKQGVIDVLSAELRDRDELRLTPELRDIWQQGDCQ